MPSGPFDGPAPLSERERRVLAELEADLGVLRLRRHWLRTTLRVLAMIAPLAGTAAGVSIAAVSTLGGAGAAALTGVACTVAATAATWLVLSSR